MKIEIAGEDAVIIYFAEKVTPKIAARIQQAQLLIRKNCDDLIVDLVPSYASMLVVFDLFKCDHHQLLMRLKLSLAELPEVNCGQGDLVEFPAYYGLDGAPDLMALAKRAQLSVEEVINIHQEQEYRVYAIGFAPGFAYLGEVDQRIATPRLTTPRTKVPCGSIAIADRQTAVYPSVSPGGWNLIGLCPMLMFNPNVQPSMPVKVGDRIKFRAINKAEFLSFAAKNTMDFTAVIS